MKSDSIREIPLLSKDECASIRDTIHGLQSSWQKRNPDFPFYTLGAASYLDATQSYRHYVDSAVKSNETLQQHFSVLYDKLAAALGSAFGGPVVYSPPLALPGFHIYQSAKIFEQPIASIHCDSQYRLLDWEFPESLDIENTYSFTLPVAMPEHGAGINVWDVHLNDIIGHTTPEVSEMLSGHTSHYHAYSCGNIALHTGHEVHQAAPGRNLTDTDERITLQGHAISHNGKWELYW